MVLGELPSIFVHLFSQRKNGFIIWTHFKALQGVNGVLFYFLITIVLKIITFSWKCILLLWNSHEKLTCISLKEKPSVETIKITVRIERNVVLHCISVVWKIINFIWKCIYLHSSRHVESSCVSLKEKQPVQALQSTVRSEGSVALLWNCCCLKYIHFLLKVH